MSETAHHDVVGGPRADSSEPEQLTVGDHRVGADVEFDVPFGHRCGQSTDRVTAGAGHRERVIGSGCEFLGSGEDVRDRADRLGEPMADGSHDPAGHRACAGDRHLLADHGPHCRLVRVDAGRRPTSGDRGHACRERRVRRQRRVHRLRVAIEIEQSTNPVHGGREVGPCRQPEPGGDVVRMGDEVDDAHTAGQIDRSTVGGPVPRLDARDRTRADEPHHLT